MEQQILTYIGSFMIAIIVAIFPTGCMCCPMNDPEYKNSKIAKIWNIIVYTSWVIAIWYFFNFSEFSKVFFDKEEFIGIACLGIFVLMIAIVLKIIEVIYGFITKRI